MCIDLYTRSTYTRVYAVYTFFETASPGHTCTQHDWTYHSCNNNNRSLFVATRVKKQTKNKVKDLTSKLGTRMETGRLRRDLLGLRVEQPPGLLFNGLI